MAFKITAKEKKLIERRRKLQAGFLTSYALKNDIAEVINFIEDSEFYGDMEYITELLSEGEYIPNIDPDLLLGTKIIYALLEKATTVAHFTRQGVVQNKFKSKKLVIDIG